MSLAKWWGKTPADFVGLTLYDLQAMAEFRDRVTEAEKDAAERAKYGLKVDEDVRRFKGRRGPRKGDTIVRGGKGGTDGW
jgi:hypothetical protein